MSVVLLLASLTYLGNDGSVLLAWVIYVGNAGRTDLKTNLNSEDTGEEIVKILENLSQHKELTSKASIN